MALVNDPLWAYRRLDGMGLRMSWHKQERSFGRAEQHAWPADFCRVFHQDMDVLYWLALTLTSDEGKAEECFVAGLEECIEGNSVFKDWARSWSRRVVIKNAIRVAKEFCEGDINQRIEEELRGKVREAGS